MFYVLFLLILSPLSAGDLYSSDGLGKRGRSVDSIHDDFWVLELEEDERILFKEGELYKRWVNKSLVENENNYRREEYYFGNELRTISVTDSKGRLIRESLFDSRGKFMVENRFFYRGDRLTVIEQRDEGGDLLKEQNLRYRADGSLRTLKASDNERIDWRAAEFSESYLDSLYLEDGSRSTLFAYEKGNMTVYREQQGENPMRQSEYIYGSDGQLDKQIFYDFSENSRTLSYYDENEKIIIENIYLNENLVRTEHNSYEEERLTVREQQGSDSRKRWEYEYKAGEQDPFLTREYINGILVKESESVEEGIRETLYRRGEAVLIRIRENEQ